jgi:ABC-type polysaccharide/polyol phosphate export permease
MEHSIAKDTYSFYHSPNYIGTGNNPRRKMEVSDMVILSETKQRYRANPFGFGITWDGLSPLQLAIAAALGITRKL